ncbi:MAG: DUF2723 domain-containing protein [Planctomycetota bacterium]
MRDSILAGALALAAFALYAATACPTVYIGDSGELIGVPWVMGVAHPTGYPLYTLLYAAALHASPWSPALTANLVTAGCAAAAVGLLYVAARGLGSGRAGAAAAAVGLVVARRWWMQAVSVEVYALDGLLLTATLAAAFALNAADRVQRPATWRVLGLCAGLWCGHRPVNVLYLVLVFLWVEVARRRGRAAARSWLHALLAALATALLYVYLPIAAAADPPLNMGDPDRWTRFLDVVFAQPYQRHLGGMNELFWQRVANTLIDLPAQLGGSLLMAGAGVWLLTRRRRSRTVLLTLLGTVALNLWFASKYNILDNDGFFQPMLVALALLAAIGFDAIAAARGTAATLTALLIAVLPAAWNFGPSSLAGERAAERYATDLLRSAAPNALILVQGDTARAALSYLQAVEQQRPDVAVLAPSMALRWHIDEVRARAPAFDLPPTPAVGAETQWLRVLIRTQLVERGDPLYLTRPDQQTMSLIGPDVLAQCTVVPAGLLSRVVWLNAAPPEAARQQRQLLEQAARFWDETPTLHLTSARRDPQLLLLPVHYARERFVLAEQLIRTNQPKRAEPHLAALAGSGVDRLEAAVAEAYLGIGRVLRPRRFGSRSAAALSALRAGATPPQLLQAMQWR